MQSTWFQRIGFVTVCLLAVQLLGSAFAESERGPFPPGEPPAEVPQDMPPMDQGFPPMDPNGPMPFGPLGLDDETQRKMMEQSQAMNEKYGDYFKACKAYNQSAKELVEAAKSLDPADADAVRGVIELAKQADEAKKNSDTTRQACRETAKKMNDTMKEVMEQMGMPAGMIPEGIPEKMFPEEGIPFDIMPGGGMIPGGGCPPFFPPQGQPPVPGNRAT